MSIMQGDDLTGSASGGVGFSMNSSQAPGIDPVAWEMTAPGPSDRPVECGAVESDAGTADAAVPSGAGNPGSVSRPGPADDSDQFLVICLAGAAAGDRAAFRALYDQTVSTLYGVALAMLRNRTEADDAVQEAYVRIWTRAGAYHSSRGRPLCWMTQILRNLVIDNWRGAKSARAMVEEAMLNPISVAIPPSGLDPDLERGLARLPEVQRTAIVGAYALGLSHRELAERMQVPVGTVKSWINRGLERLNKWMTA
jgi:RNA polymerase sigma-70 factor, ECF subfamily